MERRAVSSPPPTPEILTVPEVAKYLRVTAKTVYALVRRGQLVGFRVGRVLRLRKADVDGFVQRAAKEIEA